MISALRWAAVRDILMWQIHKSVHKPQMTFSWSERSAEAGNQTDVVRFTSLTVSGDCPVVRATDTWSKGRGFESRQERRKNFLLQGQRSVLTLISVSVPPPFTVVAHKRPRPFCQKKQVAALQPPELNTHAPCICDLAYSDVAWWMVVWCTQNVCRDGSSFTWHQPYNNQVGHFDGYSKTRYKKLRLLLIFCLIILRMRCIFLCRGSLRTADCVERRVTQQTLCTSHWICILLQRIFSTPKITRLGYTF